MGVHRNCHQGDIELSVSYCYCITCKIQFLASQGSMNDYSADSWQNIQLHIFVKGIQETLVFCPLDN